MSADEASEAGLFHACRSRNWGAAAQHRHTRNILASWRAIKSADLRERIAAIEEWRVAASELRRTSGG